MFLEISQNSKEKHLYQSLFFNNVVENKNKNSGTGVFCEFYEISKNTSFYRTPLVAASGDERQLLVAFGKY